MILRILFAAFAAAALGLSSQSAPKPVTQVKSGGVELSIPTPDGDFTESGDQLRTQFFDLMTPSTNRLLAAFITVKDKEQLLGGTPPGVLASYALVQVPRRAEYAELSPENFAEAIKGVAGSMGAALDKGMGALDEINLRLKQIGAKSVAVDKPEMLGPMFSKPDAFAWGMLMAVKAGEDALPVTMAAGTALVRLKQRIVFAYAYRRYESPATVDGLRKLLDRWTSQMLAANK